MATAGLDGWPRSTMLNMDGCGELWEGDDCAAASGQ